MPARKLSNETEAWIAQRYLAGESLRAMARELGTNHGLLASSLRRQGIEQRSPEDRNRLYSVDPDTFRQINTEAKAYWLGFLFADGNVSRRTVTLALSHKDKEHVEAFRTFMKSEAPVKDAIRLVNTLTSIVQITDRDIAADLVRLGVSAGRPNPTAAIDATPPELKHHWVRGFFDGDGSADLGKAGLNFCCPQRELLECIWALIMWDAGRSLGGIYKHKHGPVWYLSFAGLPSCTAVVNYMYKDASVYLERKRQRTLNWKQPAPGWWRRPTINGRFVKADSVQD